MSARAARWLPLALALAALGALGWRFLWICDDAYISFRYARHLAEGHGLRFNVLDPPIEGYTNCLWVLVAAAVERAGLPVTVAMVALSGACAVALVVLLDRRLQRLAGEPSWLTAIPLLAVATLPGLAVWSSSGLATVPNALCLFALWDAAFDERGPRARAAPLAALAILLRADAFLWVFLILGSALALRRGGPRRALVVALATAAVTFGALCVFRVAYFGDWLPNTARVKTGVSAMRLERGLKYVGLYLLTFPGVALALVVAATGGAQPHAALRASAAAVVAATCAYAIWVGGDFMAMGRLLVVALPFVAVLLAIALVGGRTSSPRPRRAAALGGLVLLVAIPTSIGVAFDRYAVPESWRAALHFRWNTERFQSEWKQWSIMRARCETWKRIGLLMAERAEPGQSLVIGTIGAVGYHSELHLLDPHGLVNRLGGEPADRERRRSPGHDREIPIEVFLALEPDFVNAELVPASKPDYLLPDYMKPGSPHLAHIDVELQRTPYPNALLRLARWRR